MAFLTLDAHHYLQLTSNLKFRARFSLPGTFLILINPRPIHRERHGTEYIKGYVGIDHFIYFRLF
jgi:hypothetical protein